MGWADFCIYFLKSAGRAVAVAVVAGLAGAYFDAHLAWSCVAWKTPSWPYIPTASAWASSLNVSGGGSTPL